ncbi:MAG TPA: hypothetical protein VFM43_00670 [Gaiellaceae bacterium]|nr:hypothetical protein [Gaiellaceae bacterium]
MGLSDWLRRIFSGPVEAADEDAVRREEFAEPHAGPDDPRLTATSGGAVMPGMPASQPGDIVEAEQEELEPPPDSAP